MKLFCLLFTVFFLSVKAPAAGLASTVNTPYRTSATADPSDRFYEVLASLKIKEIEKLLGRKLKLKERVAVKVYQWKIRKGWRPGEKGESSEKGKTAFAFGLAAIISLFIPYAILLSLPCAILAIVFGNQALKMDRKDSKGRTGMILGWISIGLLVLALVLIIAILSAGTWGWG